MNEIFDQDLIESGRASIINGLIDYCVGFGIMAEEEVTQDVLSDIEEGLETFEAAIPVLISMYEMTKKISGNPDLSFMDWVTEVLDKSGGKEFNLF